MPSSTTLLDNSPPTLLQNPRLSRNIRQPTHDLAIPLGEPIQRIRKTDLVTEGADQLLRSSQIMSRDTRVEMMDGLELQTAVDEVQPGRTIDVHGCAEHALRETFRRA